MDDDQQFCLRWNNHQSTLVSVFDTLLEKGIHVDCTLAAEGQMLKAHKVVLSACSPYFENVLSQQFDKHPIIILKDVKYAELRAMMDYMYRGEVNISQDQLAALLKAAESLQIKGLSDNKPSRPPSRPAPPAPAAPLPAPLAHPPRAISPPPQVRDGSVDSRDGSESPTRRRKKARRLSSEGVPPPPPPPAAEPQGNGEEPPCKEETTRDGVEDLTIDEEADDPPHHTHNDVVRNFQWHMERSQDEIMNSSDGVRDSQEPPLRLTRQTFAQTSYPLTRGFLKAFELKPEDAKEKGRRGRKSRKIKVNPLAKRKYTKKTCQEEDGVGQNPFAKRKCTRKSYKEDDEIDIKPLVKRKYKKRKIKVEDGTPSDDKRYICSICKKKHYKYRRNKLRHEKYECVSGPQFVCHCGKKYSQKKTLVSHMALKHSDIKIENVKSESEST